MDRPSTGGRHGWWREAAREVPTVRVDRHTMDGLPTVGDTRIAAAQVLALLAEGVDVQGIVAEYDGLLTVEDVRAVLLFAVALTS